MSRWLLLQLVLAVGALAQTDQSFLGWPSCPALQPQTLVNSDCSLTGVRPAGLYNITGSADSTSSLVSGAAPALDVASAQALGLVPGGQVQLRNLVLVYHGPQLPLALPSTSSLHMRAVRVLASRAAFTSYNTAYQAAVAATAPNATVYTDNATWMHVNWGGYAPNFQQLSVRGFGLLAHDDVDNRAQLSAGLANSSDSAGPLNYVLSATRATLIPTLRRLASRVTPVPLLVYVTSNVTMTRADVGPAGIAINRPLVLMGHAMRKTSIDFGMDVNLLNLTGSPYSNLTLDSLVLENLGYGDAVSATSSRAASLSVTNGLWAVYFNRTQLRLIIRNCTFVLGSKTELDYITYWSTAYNSPLPFFQNQALTARLRASAAAWQVASAGNSDSLILVKVILRSIHVYDTLTTTIPQVARALSLPPNDGLNVPLTANQAPPVTITIDNVPGLVEAVRQSDTLPDASVTALLGSNMSWAAGAASNWPVPGGLVVARPMRITGTPAPGSTGARWVAAITVDLGYTRQVLKVPDTVLTAGAVSFTLLQFDSLPQGPNAATATGLTPDVFTLLLWFIDRPAGIPSSLILQNVTLRLPPQELRHIRTLAQRSNVFGLTPDGPSGSSIAFINVSVISDTQLWVSTMEGYGIFASRLRLVEDTTYNDPDYRWPYDPITSGSGGSTAPWVIAVSIVASVLAASLIAFGAFVFCRQRQRPELGDEEGKPPDSPTCPCPPEPLRKLSEAFLKGSRSASVGSGTGNASGSATNSSARITVETNPPSVAGSSRSKSIDVKTGFDRDRGRRRSGQGSGQKGIAEESPFIGAAGAAAAAAAVGSSGGAGASPGGRRTDNTSATDATEGSGVAHSGPSLVNHTWRRLHKAISSVSQDLQQRRVDAMLPVQSSGTLPRSVSDVPSGLRASGSGTSSMPGRQSSQGSASTAAAAGPVQQLQLSEILGHGNFGAVYRGLWRGTPVAVKVMQLPASSLGGLQSGILQQQAAHQAASQQEAGAAVAPGVAKHAVREQLAVREAAISVSAAVSHPNIVQVYTYTVRPITLDDGADGHTDSSNSGHTADPTATAASPTVPPQPPVVAWELRLVMELCDQGSLRTALDNQLLFDLATNRPHHATVLALALDVAYAMVHLHSESILHGDLKCSNVLLKQALTAPTPRSTLQAVHSGATLSAPYATAGGTTAINTVPGARLIAKVADFGLSLMMDPAATHVSHMHGGTLTHMAPELLTHGHASKASDVYAFGVLCWELATGGKAFAGTPRALLGHQIVQERRRPEWPVFLGSAYGSGADGALNPNSASEARFRALVEQCWAHEPADRPTFEQIAEELGAMLDLLAQQQMQQQLAEASPQRGGVGADGADITGSFVAATTLLPYYRPASALQRPQPAAVGRAVVGPAAVVGGGSLAPGDGAIVLSSSTAGGGVTETGLSYSALARVVAEILAGERQGSSLEATNEAELAQQMRHTLQQQEQAPEQQQQSGSLVAGAVTAAAGSAPDAAGGAAAAGGTGAAPVGRPDALDAAGAAGGTGASLVGRPDALDTSIGETL